MSINTCPPLPESTDPPVFTPPPPSDIPHDKSLAADPPPSTLLKETQHIVRDIGTGLSFGWLQKQQQSATMDYPANPLHNTEYQAVLACFEKPQVNPKLCFDEVRLYDNAISKHISEFFSLVTKGWEIHPRAVEDRFLFHALFLCGHCTRKIHSCVVFEGGSRVHRTFLHHIILHFSLTNVPRLISPEVFLVAAYVNNVDTYRQYMEWTSNPGIPTAGDGLFSTDGSGIEPQCMIKQDYIFISHCTYHLPSIQFQTYSPPS